MARLPRLHIPGGWYFLTLRSYQDRDLFPRPPQRWLFEQMIAEAAAQTCINVHAFCLLETRVRMIVEITNIPVSDFMQLVSSRYARALRNATSMCGRLFRDRHDVLLFDVDRHLLDLLCAVHLEPVRSGAAADPQEYMWSSHRDYLDGYQGHNPRPWLVTTYALSSLHEQRSLACNAYRQFVASHVREPPDPEALQPHARDPRILGDDAFLASLKLRAGQSTRNPALENLTEEICRTNKITLEALRSPCQSRALSIARGLIAARALRLRTASLTEIARHLNRSVSAIARSAQRYDSSLDATTLDR